MTNSRSKGKRGELEAAAAIRETFNVPARRGQQFSGGNESPDVVHGLNGVHVEVKRTESFRLWASLDQAKADAGEGETPIVLHRPNRRPWVVIVELERLPALAAAIHSQELADDSGINDTGRNAEG